MGCRFSSYFCAHHENQANIFQELLGQCLGQFFAKSQLQISIFFASILVTGNHTMLKMSVYHPRSTWIFFGRLRGNKGDIYTLFDGLAYNTCGDFASCVVFSEPRRGEEKYEQRAKCPLVLYAKPSNKRFIISLQKKKCYFAIGNFFGKSIQKHPDSVSENDANNEQHVCWYYMSNH